jgi:8-amino-7-oxononanoate synthase
MATRPAIARLSGPGTGSMLPEHLQKRLLFQKQAELYRRPLQIKKRDGKYLLIDDRKILNFASNDYLGLGVSGELRQRVAKNFSSYGTSSSSSRLVTGNYAVISEAEREYAAYFGYEDALFFPSGYQANIGVLSSLFNQDDILIFDKHIHASAVKGIVLSKARFHGYNHNSMAHLHRRLDKNSKGRITVVTESLFSMDGDLLDVETLLHLKHETGFFSIVDEAHAFGVLGQKGKGIARDVADIAVGTFGKALGLFGAFVLLPEGLKEYLLNFCSPLIYTTTLPEAHAASAIDLLDILSRCEDRREYLAWISRFMKNRLTDAGFTVTGDAHILAIEIGDETRCMEISKRLFEKNVFVLPARFPTAPLHRSQLTIGMTALHTENDVRHLVDSLKKAYGDLE